MYHHIMCLITLNLTAHYHSLENLSLKFKNKTVLSHFEWTEIFQPQAQDLVGSLVPSLFNSETPVIFKTRREFYLLGHLDCQPQIVFFVSRRQLTHVHFQRTSLLSTVMVPM